MSNEADGNETTRVTDLGKVTILPLLPETDDKDKPLLPLVPECDRKYRIAVCVHMLEG